VAESPDELAHDRPS
jgi:hypothetical protein